LEPFSGRWHFRDLSGIQRPRLSFFVGVQLQGVRPDHKVLGLRVVDRWCQAGPSYSLSEQRLGLSSSTVVMSGSLIPPGFGDAFQARARDREADFTE
jgi:hypothetical protein